MFSLFDYFFREEKSKIENLANESHWLQTSVTQDEYERVNNLDDNQLLYSKAHENQAIVHTREDVILLVAHLTRTNILLRWIRFLLLVLIIILCYKFFN
jgi:hypothetical protein